MAEFLTDEEIDALLEIAEQGELPKVEVEFKVATAQEIVERYDIANYMANVVATPLPDLNPKQIELGLQFATKLLGEDYEIPTYKLADIQSQIIDWNICRNNINYDADTELDMALDELDREYEDADSDEQRIDALNDFYIIYIGTLAKSGMEGEELTPELLELYEEFKKIPKRVKSLGYCFRKAMKECLAEINSREQDPVQVEEWAKNGASGKWLKNENSSTGYKADYSKALICKDCDGKEG